MTYRNNHPQNIEVCQKCKTHFITLLNGNNIWFEDTKYPNLILTARHTVKVVSPHTKCPKFLAVDANSKLADLYVGYLRHGNCLMLVGFAYGRDFSSYPAAPDAGWMNPTQRILIENLQCISSLLEELK